jgi:hypothetical protein
MGPMTERDWRRSLRGAIYREDGMAVVALVRTGGLRDDALQLLGDGLLVAITGHVEHAVELGTDCVNALRARGWYGDDDLAEQLDAALGRGAIPIRRSLPIDLDELATILEADPVNSGGRIDLMIGEVWPRAAIDYARETGEEDEDESDDPDRWLWVDCEGSRDAYRDMEWFIGTIADRDRADRLEIAIEGKGAFRRFKDVLARLARPARTLVHLLRGAPARPGARLARSRRLLPGIAQPTWNRAVNHSPGGRHRRDPDPGTVVSRSGM